MAHPDKSWRVAAIYRCCVRRDKNFEWCYEQLSKLRVLSPDGNVIAHPSYPRLANIWFDRTTPVSLNHIEKQRHAYRQGERY